MDAVALNPKAETIRRTYRLDLLRGGFDGVIETGSQTFCLFIAIRHFNAGNDAKSLIAAASSIGMMFSPVIVHYASGTGARKSLCGAVPAALTGLFLLVSAWAGSLVPFCLFVILGYMFQNASFPFVTGIYNDNYPAGKRGEFFSKPQRLNVGISVLFSYLASRLLDLSLEYFALVFGILALCALGKSWAIYSMPSQAIEKGARGNPLGNLAYAIRDKAFGYVLLTWFIMGFANLWIAPLRIDYLASRAYGIEGSATLVAVISIVIPNIMRLLFIPFWGRLFDRLNFVALRMILNALFAAGVGLYFLTRNPAVIAMGSALLGLSLAGGSIAWNLWVTKYAPPGKTEAYMSVHVFLTGVRGAVGPMIGFWAVGYLGPLNIGLLSAALMLLASAMLIPEMRRGGRDTPA